MDIHRVDTPMMVRSRMDTSSIGVLHVYTFCSVLVLVSKLSADLQFLEVLDHVQHFGRSV